MCLFKQKTAYELRISDWSSDVCSSDLIGSHAVLALLDAGHRVVVIDNLVTGFAWAIDPRAAFVEMAVEDARVRDVIAEHGVEAIMHFAGSVVVPESVSDPLKYYRNNTARSEEHTSELQSLMRISYAVFCLKKKKQE